MFTIWPSKKAKIFTTGPGVYFNTGANKAEKQPEKISRLDAENAMPSSAREFPQVLRARAHGAWLRP
jgi:hypothetical protein